MIKMDIMTKQQRVTAINSLCLSNEYSAISRLLVDVPGAFAILISDQTAEQKRQRLLELLKEGEVKA